MSYELVKALETIVCCGDDWHAKPRPTSEDADRLGLAAGEYLDKCPSCRETIGFRVWVWETRKPGGEVVKVSRQLECNSWVGGTVTP